ncbi:mas-related G-protein coupled receptor member X4-like [Thamnophis elegans]|uniref:mas-related G-protein coupled receptor member X4-like n=1 Tax=Thamnophis elegans TaxID=35005 RepID=UPI0013766234|nr:mas-related G-protein coupled receptor member X4-like [Thamnophis elegans]
MLIICCIGIPLNGIVIWLLGFQIKRNPFTVLILNLAIADFGLLVSLAIFCTCFIIYFWNFTIPSMILSHIMYINGLFLLAAISIDRCMCVLFPIWHRCSRPKHLSPIIKRRKLVVMILITLLCFLIFNLPLNIYGFYAVYIHINNNPVFFFSKFIYFGASLNSSVNPVIYYLVGRKRQAQTRESIKVVFQRVFKEDGAPESREISTNRASTPL